MDDIKPKVKEKVETLNDLVIQQSKIRGLLACMIKQVISAFERKCGKNKKSLAVTEWLDKNIVTDQRTLLTADSFIDIESMAQVYPFEPYIKKETQYDILLSKDPWQAKIALHELFSRRLFESDSSGSLTGLISAMVIVGSLVKQSLTISQVKSGRAVHLPEWFLEIIEAGDWPLRLNSSSVLQRLERGNCSTIYECMVISKTVTSLIKNFAYHEGDNERKVKKKAEDEKELDMLTCLGASCSLEENIISPPVHQTLVDYSTDYQEESYRLNINDDECEFLEEFDFQPYI